MGELKVFEAFAGVGAQRMALRNLGLDFEVVGICEIDKFALKSYEAIHGECNNFGDISKVDPNELPDMDLFTYSFPCQDLSIAGKREGLKEGTRSGLLYECEKIIEVKKPKYLLLENVKNLVGKKFKPDFDKWLNYLEGLGYKNYWKVLNAKDYGVPQNRERVFVVSILEDNKGYNFPEAKELENKFIDILEPSVEDKYFLSEKANEKITRHGNKIINSDTPEVSSCIHAGYYKMGGRDQQYVKSYKFPQPVPLNKAIKDILEDTVDEKYYMNKPFKLVNKGNVKAEFTNINFDQGKRIYGTDSYFQCLGAADRGTNNILISAYLTDFGYKQTSKVLNKEGIAATLDTMQGGHREPKILEEHRVRKLTPLECWRLMSFTDEDFYKAKNAGISNSQLYKQAGNSIVVKVLEGIFKNLLIDNEQVKEITTEEEKRKDRNIQLKWCI